MPARIAPRQAHRGRQPIEQFLSIWCMKEELSTEEISYGHPIREPPNPGTHL